MNDLTTLQFILGAIAFISGTMIGLQAAVRKAVWNGYLVIFFVSAVWLAGTVLL